MTNTMNYTNSNNDNFNDRPIIIALAIVCLITLLFGFIHKWYDNTHYSNVCYIDSITEDEVLMIDSCGDIWAVDAIEGAKVGDLVDVYFYNNGTEYTHTDDIITYVKII